MRAKKAVAGRGVGSSPGLCTVWGSRGCVSPAVARPPPPPQTSHPRPCRWPRRARYGGGVEGDAYANPAVSMSHVYLACRAWWLPDLTCLDLYVFLMGLGFVKSVGDMYWRMLQGGKGAAPARGGSQLASKASMRLATSASSTSLASMASAASEEGAALKVVAVEASGR